MSSPNDRYYEIAHIKARLAGEEGADHPRQRLCAFLEQEGHRDRVARANEFYEFRGAKRSPGGGLLQEVLDFAFFDPHSAYREDPAFQELVDRAVEYALEPTIQLHKLQRAAAALRHVTALERAVATLDAERLRWSDEGLRDLERYAGRDDRLDAYAPVPAPQPSAGGQAGDSAPRTGPSSPA
ncbi:hypothetical protein [Comamonas aquatica]|uniref:hypothetical protein n=1 Tax=Comamonas aquatica TaxID=225991 RepID=UPI0024482D3C|nr:hypothetical protein [Comamonas aquatica]MDH0200704.1 hypothetical protein [Comamonas aquatica]MDH1445576.1 hypothetical protein [Comamonas aquatica]